MKAPCLGHTFCRISAVHSDGQLASPPTPPPDSDLLASLARARSVRQGEEVRLIAGIREHQADLDQLLSDTSGHWGYEDPVYRFWHQSFKVYRVQDDTLRIVDALRQLAPHRPLNPWFEEIVAAGTGVEFDVAHNEEWLSHTRPLLEAFFHARFFLEMAVRYSHLEAPPDTLPSGWAALLYLFDLRF
ncbi:MAG: hypothetical protein ACYDGR_09840 [Candidatus Dormibacteria bacterium]